MFPHLGFPRYVMSKNSNRAVPGTIMVSKPDISVSTQFRTRQMDSRGPQPVEAILMDIEGTTTSISFVKDVLFPYARKHVKEFLNNTWESTDTQSDIQALKEQLRSYKLEGLEGVPEIDDGGTTEEVLESVTESVNWLMDHDKKVTALKQLQGRIWSQGYKRGALLGHVYPDVLGALKMWKMLHTAVYIYSSGSVEAQKLLFGYSEAGNLLQYIDGHFDTKTGSKRDEESYKKIVKAVGVEADRMTFYTDIYEEATAAKKAGLQVVILKREGNAPLPEAAEKQFVTISDFNKCLSVAGVHS